MNNHERGGMCGCGHHNIVPILMILFGTSFLLQYQGILTVEAVNIIWPILVGIAGVVKLTEDKCGCC